MAHSPVISLIGGRFGHSKHKLPYQEVDDFPMFEPVTKANLQVDEVGRIPDMIRMAFRRGDLRHSRTGESPVLRQPR